VSRGEPIIRNISDTARWVAYHRAIESERPDAVFRDPFARRLAGERGQRIATELGASPREQWPWVARTHSFDQFILGRVRDGADVVINLAAGFDTRPYRLPLPETLQWYELDLPELIDEKEQLLANDKPACRLERFRIDLANTIERRRLFDELAGRGKNVVVACEGLIIYLTRDEVSDLARDLARPATFRHWIVELASPGLLEMLQRRTARHLPVANAPLKFAPPEGPAFFDPLGWRPAEIQSMIQVARRLKRLPFFLRLIARLPETHGRQGRRPWSAVCLYERK